MPLVCRLSLPVMVCVALSQASQAEPIEAASPNITQGFGESDGGVPARGRATRRRAATRHGQRSAVIALIVTVAVALSLNCVMYQELPPDLPPQCPASVRTGLLLTRSRTLLPRAETHPQRGADSSGPPVLATAT
jgi:hypothetical protein